MFGARAIQRRREKEEELKVDSRLEIKIFRPTLTAYFKHSFDKNITKV